MRGPTAWKSGKTFRRCLFAYSTDRADRVAAELERFANAYDYMVAGQVANLDFWLLEVEQALAAIDGYNSRFRRLADAQHDWISRHHVVVGTYCPQCGGRCEFDDGLKGPRPPRRVPSHEFEASRRRVRDAAYNFLVRAHRIGALDGPTLREASERLDLSIDPGDLS